MNTFLLVLIPLLVPILMAPDLVADRTSFKKDFVEHGEPRSCEGKCTIGNPGRKDNMECTRCCRNSELKATHGKCKQEYNAMHNAVAKLECSCSTLVQTKTDWKATTNCMPKCKDRRLTIDTIRSMCSECCKNTETKSEGSGCGLGLWGMTCYCKFITKSKVIPWTNKVMGIRRVPTTRSIRTRRLY